MWAKSLTVMVVLFVTSSQACEVNKGCDINIEDGNIKSLKDSMDIFSIALMNVMYGDTQLDGNLIFSPANVYVALFLIMSGTDNAKQELIAALQLVDKDIGAMTEALKAIVNGLEVLNTAKIRSEEITIQNLSLGEVLYVQSGLKVKDAYLQLLQSLDSETRSMDFTRSAAWATAKINQWINNQTGKRNPLTFTSLVDPATKLLMSTAPYFSGKWPENFFDPAHNGLGTFTSAAGQANVIMMSASQTLWFYDNKADCAAITLPFQDSKFVLHIIMPYGSQNPDNFVKGFNMEIWNAILTQATEVAITVKIPKMALAWTGEINQQLQALNVKQIFQGANFLDMVEYQDAPIHLSSFTQSAGFTISEIGMSMPDITPPSTTQTPLPGPNNPPAFIMDKPCLFIVRELKTSLIVFTSYIRQL